jgi:hypothetical protein
MMTRCVFALKQLLTWIMSLGFLDSPLLIGQIAVRRLGLFSVKGERVPVVAAPDSAAEELAPLGPQTKKLLLHLEEAAALCAGPQMQHVAAAGAALCDGTPTAARSQAAGA